MSSSSDPASAVGAPGAGDVSDYCECDDVLTDEPVRQGDVIEWHPEHREEPWKRYGIVVTANCDMARRKHAGIISYVPALPVVEYLTRFIVVDELEKLRSSHEPRLVEAVHSVQRRRAPNTPPITPDRLLRWAEEEEPQTIAGILCGDDAESRTAATNLLEPYYASAPARGALACDQMIKLVVLFGGRADRLRDRMRSAVTNPPGDWFFLHALSSATPGGYMVYLRLVRELREMAIATRWDALHNTEAKRVARVRSPFIFQLTRQLGDVFAAIGLPEEYDVSHRAYAQTVATKLTAGHPEQRG